MRAYNIQHITLEDKIPDSILNHVKKKNRTLTNLVRSQCPCKLKNVASLELVELKSKQFNQLSQQSITGESVRLSYTSLFKGDLSEEKFNKKILIVGEAGTGKSVLCAQVTEEWTNGALFQEFQMIILLSLNQRSIASATNLPELLHNSYEFDSKSCSTVEMYLSHKNILIIADGWDQLCESDSRGSFLHGLLFGDLLPSSSLTVVVTTTPSLVPHQFKGRFITLQGFTEQTAKSFIEMELSTNPEKISYITEQLETNPLLRSMCSVPLNLAMICNFCQSHDDPLPGTMPELYKKLAWSLAQSKINTMTGRALRLSNHQDLPQNLQQSWFQLCQLAFEKCQVENAQIIAFPSDIETFGLLKSVSVGSSEVMFSFLYPVFKYYLAASYIVIKPQSVQLEIIKSMHNISSLFCRLYLNMNTNSSPNIISEIIQKLSELHHSFKDMCLISYESKNDVVDEAIMKLLQASESAVMLHSHNAYECEAVIHVM